LGGESGLRIVNLIRSIFHGRVLRITQEYWFESNPSYCPPFCNPDGTN
jgi:hypothetical protein